jgi:hypothetical protein
VAGAKRLGRDRIECLDAAGSDKFDATIRQGLADNGRRTGAHGFQNF